MAATKDGTANVTLATTQLKPPVIDWSTEDVYMELTTFNTLAKMWLETKGFPDHKQCILILQSLGEGCLHSWESFPLAAPNNNYKGQPDHIWEAFEGS